MKDAPSGPLSTAAGMGRFILRGVGLLFIVCAPIAFFLALYNLIKLPGAYHCIGAGCPYQTPEAGPTMLTWMPVIPISIFAFIGGIFMYAFSGGGAMDTTGALGRFGEVTDAGQLRTRQSQSHVATIMAQFSGFLRNGLVATALFEFALAGFFLWVASIHPETRGSMLLTAGILGAVGLGLFWGGIKSHANLVNADRLQSSGLDGEAKILGLTQTGIFLNQNPLVEMDLEVHVGGWEPYRVRHREYVPLINLGQLTGNAVRVKVDPNDRSNLLIEWSSSTLSA